MSRVWAVILIGVCINGLDEGFDQSMEMVGPNHFFVDKWPWRDVGDEWRKYYNRPNMQTGYAEEMNEIIMDTPNSELVVAVPTQTVERSVAFEDRVASRIQVTGTTEDFGYISTAEIAAGRFFSGTESQGRQNVVVLGSGVVDALFPEANMTVVGKRVKIANIGFEVIGVLEEQGSFLGMHSFDNQAIIPLSSLHKFFTGWRSWNGASIRVVKKPDAPRDVARDEIVGAMRIIRGLEPGEVNDFEVNATDMIEDTLGPVKRNIAIGGFLITGLALFVGAVGIMNITFVSVKERTREIGTRRAIGARRSSILIQFLIEAVSICLLGGAVGLALAFGSKAAVSAAVPWFPASFSVDLIALAFTLSVATGILSGFIPAYLASRLDPASALRHE